MKAALVGSTCIAALTLTTGVFAQATQTPAAPAQPTPSPQSASPRQTESATTQQVTLVGCVQREADYRRARDAGKGGVAGSGIGVQNEFILVAASMPSNAAQGSSSGAVGTSGVAAAGRDYELTGEGEGQLGQHVGRRVEIVGKVKPAEVGPAGPTGGATAGRPPEGIDVTSADLKLHELEVTSVRTASGSCPSAR